METKLEKLRGELIADIEKEIRRRGVINYENNECIELPCNPGNDACEIEHNSEVVYMARIVYIPATLIGSKDKTKLVSRVVIETDQDEYAADELFMGAIGCLDTPPSFTTRIGLSVLEI